MRILRAIWRGCSGSIFFGGPPGGLALIGRPAGVRPGGMRDAKVLEGIVQREERGLFSLQRGCARRVWGLVFLMLTFRNIDAFFRILRVRLWLLRVGRVGGGRIVVRLIQLGELLVT